MKRKITKAFTLAAAILALSAGVNAQNTASYDMNSSTPTVNGNDNSAFGVGTLGSNSGGSDNTASGYLCMAANVNGSSNTASGYACLIQNDGYGNSAYGVKCLDGNTTGSGNSALGVKGLATNVSGNNNSSLGVYADVNATGLTNATAIGANAIVNANDRVWLGDINTKVWTTNAYIVSDGRFKKNVDASKVKGLDFIRLLRPVVYNFDGKAFTDHVSKNMSAETRKHHLERDFSKASAELQTGFIAQEVEEAAKKAGYTFSGVHAPEGETDTYGVSYYQFVVPLVKAVQEQQQMIDEQKTANQHLMQSHQQLLQQIADQQKAIDALTAASKIQGATGISSQSSMSSFAMEQNEPNPFTHETLVKYNLPEQANNAYMAVYDLSGKQIATFALTQKGNGSLTITSEKLSAGIYIYSIVSDGKVFDSKKMIVADK